MMEEIEIALVGRNFIILQADVVERKTIRLHLKRSPTISSKMIPVSSKIIRRILLWR